MTNSKTENRKLTVAECREIDEQALGIARGITADEPRFSPAAVAEFDAADSIEVVDWLNNHAEDVVRNVADVELLAESVIHYVELERN